MPGEGGELNQAVPVPEPPLTEALLDALGTNDQVAATAASGETALVLTRTPWDVLAERLGGD
jgi:hypothetical protein